MRKDVSKTTYHVHFIMFRKLFGQTRIGIDALMVFVNMRNFWQTLFVSVICFILARKTRSKTNIMANNAQAQRGKKWNDFKGKSSLSLEILSIVISLTFSKPVLNLFATMPNTVSSCFPRIRCHFKKVANQNILIT